MMTHGEFVTLVDETLKAQQRYFKTRTSEALEYSKGLERECRAQIKDYHASKSPSLFDRQPDPVPNAHEPTWDAVIRDLETNHDWLSHVGLVIKDARERDAMGYKKYGTRLQPFNGRDSLRDAYEEALDLLVYLYNAVTEGSMVDEQYRDSVSLCVAIRVKLLRRDGK